MSCNCYKYAIDYRRLCDLAQKMANVEKINYVVYQKEDKSYGFAPAICYPTKYSVLFRAIPND